MPGRPSRDETRERTARFLRLCAQGLPYDEAAERARVKPTRALRIVSEPEFARVVAAIRESGETVAVMLDARAEAQAA